MTHLLGREVYLCAHFTSMKEKSPVYSTRQKLKHVEHDAEYQLW